MAISQAELEAAIHRAILLYNRLKSPQAVAKAIRVTSEAVTIGFSGSFCYSCAVPLTFVNDFTADLKIITRKIELKLLTTRQTGTNSFEADYLVKAL